MELPKISSDQFTVHWPEPPQFRFVDEQTDSEPCEIEFKNGRKVSGTVLHFTGRDEYLIFRPETGHAQHHHKMVVTLAKVRQMRLTRPATIAPNDDGVLRQAGAAFAPDQVQVYNVEFVDGEITSGETAGFVKLPSGLFLYFRAGDSHVQRILIPESAITYHQIGDPIGKLLVEEHAVSEEQLKEAVTKQQEMRKLVLGDYLLEQGYITGEQLESALAYQKVKPSLRLGEALIEMGALTSDALQSALARQRANRGRPLGQILVDMGALDPAVLKKIHAKKMGLPSVSLVNIGPSVDALRLVPLEAAQRLRVLPMAIEDGALIVAVCEVPDAAVTTELAELSLMRIVPVLAPAAEILEKQDEFYGTTIEIGPVVEPEEMVFDSSSGVCAGASDEELRALFVNGRSINIIEEVTPDSGHQLSELLQRVLAVSLQGGDLEMRIRTCGKTRHTHIQLRGESP